MQPTRVGRGLPMLADSDFNNVTRGGQTWRYADSGEGPAVVLIHGFPDTPQSYSGIARALNEAGYRTIVPYLRGYHLDTLVPDRPYDALSLAEDAVGLLDALELKSAVFVGHDWGAMLIWGAAALAPNRVDGIVPIAIPHPLTLRPKNVLQAVGVLIMARHFLYFRLPWAAVRTRRGNFRYIDSLYRRWAPNWKGPERDVALARVKEIFETREVLDASLDYYRALGSKIDPRLLGEVACSGLLVAGGRDFGGHIGPYKKSQAMLRGGAKLLVVPEAGHWPHREEESQFTDELLRFLDGVHGKKRSTN